MSAAFASGRMPRFALLRSDRLTTRRAVIHAIVGSVPAVPLAVTGWQAGKVHRTGSSIAPPASPFEIERSR